jgi:O-antigen ligase
MAPDAQQGEPPADAGEFRATLPAGIAAVALLAGLFAWWAWKEGAYFETVFLPGAIVLCAGLVVIATAVPLPRVRAAPLVAVGSLLLLAAWAALSALWSPSPDIALGDGQRVAVYALLFVAGLWAGQLLGPRRTLVLVPIVCAAAVAGVLAGVQLAAGDAPRDFLELDGTLDYPLGYRNALAAFAGMALIPCAALAGDAGRDWRLRAPSLAAATLCVCMFILSQSRASAPAIALAVAVYILLSPFRLRALAWLVLAVIPALATVPAAAELYRTVGDDSLRAAVPAMNDAGVAVLIAGAIALAVGAMVTSRGDRLPVFGSESPRSNRAVAIAMAAAVAVAAVAFAAAVGNPVSWIGDRVDEFKTQGTPDLSKEASRFTFNAGSERYELWDIAIEEGLDEPLQGTGAGGFQHAFLRERADEGRPVRDAHSVELEILAELGIPGLALFGIAIVAAGVGALRSGGSSRQAAVLRAAAVGAGTYWLVHSSIDWFWAYPAVTGPVFALLGAASASEAARVIPSRRRWPAAALIALLAVFALTVVPRALSKSYVEAAYDGWRTDLERAYDDLDRARALDPLSDDPWLAEGVIARASGDRARALTAFREAAATQSEEWASHYLIAKLAARSDPALSRAEIEIALRQNPEGEVVRRLARQLASDHGRAPAPDANPG